MMQVLPLSGLVLAGGHSRRLGRDKSLLRLWGPDGPTLLEAMVSRLAALCDDVWVVSDGPRDWPSLPVRHIYDRYPAGGALGGIYTGLLAAEHAHALVVAVDMPLLNPALLRFMAGRSRDYDVLIPRMTSPAGVKEEYNPLYIEPLHAIYGRPCRGPMQELLERGRRRIVEFFPQVRVRYLEAFEWQPLDPQGHSFRNINTPQDLEEVQQLLARLQPPLADPGGL